MSTYDALSYNEKHEIESVKKVMFGILSPQEIIARSVVEVKTTDTFSGNDPVPDGLFDLRLGSLEPNVECLTCDCVNILCQGHQGHIVLAEPVFHPKYFDIVKKILKCVCFKCAHLLANLEAADVQSILEHRVGSRRFDEMASKCTGNKGGICWNPECARKQPRSYARSQEDAWSITAEIPLAAAAPAAAVVAEAEGEAAEGAVAEGAPPEEAALAAEAAMAAGPATERRVFSARDVLELFSRITNTHVRAMGFNPKTCRPEWLIQSVQIVPSPIMRPSARNEAGQRCDDDLTTCLSEIIKFNNQLKKKKESNATVESIRDVQRQLQLYSAAFIDNEAGAGKPTVTSHSKRPLTGVCKRLKKKEGRVRNNLMGKRCDQTARAVITPDPHISINELGVPLRIAMTQTFGETVNRFNRDWLEKLVRNGPEVYPGATHVHQHRNGMTDVILIRGQTGESAQTPFELRNGDVVMRHLADGDVVLFNRQPSLHKLSMMAHRVRVMPHNTFRLNVCTTSPYNADFDGDEMNTHNAQSVQTRSELADLASVQNIMISPKDCRPAITPVQDCLLGAYRMTRDGCEIPRRYFMNFMMKASRFAGVLPKPGGRNGTFTGRQAFSAALWPGAHFEGPNNVWKDGDDRETSPNWVVVRNGEHLRGALTKNSFGQGSLLHAAWADEGPNTAMRLLNDMQRIINAWLRIDGFSVGIADLIPTPDVATRLSENASEMYKKAAELVANLHLHGIENNSTQSNADFFEERMRKVCTDRDDDSKKIFMKMLNDDNRMIMPIRCESKGNSGNIFQMSGGVGQQIVDGKRVLPGPSGRTTPHFTSGDRSPEARGYVKSSFMDGLSPIETFFHAISGREGLIDTAVRTSETGYLQRQLVKTLEDCKVVHDLTVRGATGNIIQFLAGDDGFDPAYVERQRVPCLLGTPLELAARHLLTAADVADLKAAVLDKALLAQGRKEPRWLDRCRERFERVLEDRKFTAENALSDDSEHSVSYPVPFARMVAAAEAQAQAGAGRGRKTDLTPLDVLAAGDRLAAELGVTRRNPANRMLGVLVRGYLCPKRLVLRSRLRTEHPAWLESEIRRRFRDAYANPGDMTGIVAAQSIGETTTQLTLNSFHASGTLSAAKATSGVARLKELMLCSKEIKSPIMTVYMAPDIAPDQQASIAIENTICLTRVRDLLQSSSIYFDPPTDADAQAEADVVAPTMLPDDLALVERYRESEGLGGTPCDRTTLNPWLVRLEFDRGKLFAAGLTLMDVAIKVQTHLRNGDAPGSRCVFSDDVEERLVMRLHAATGDRDDEVAAIKAVEQGILSLAIKGVTKIERTMCSLRQTTRFDAATSEFVQSPEWVIDTAGTNLSAVLARPGVDQVRTITNDVMEVYEVLGIEAARHVMYNEIRGILSSIAHRHLSLLVDLMTNRGSMMPISRHGINRTDSMPLAKCSFETVDSTLIKAALWGEYDSMAGISANIMLGQLPPCGTADSDILLDVERLAELLPEDATADPTFDRGPIQGDAAPPGPAFHAIDAAPPVVTAAIPAARRTVTYAATNYTIEDDA